MEKEIKISLLSRTDTSELIRSEKRKMTVPLRKPEYNKLIQKEYKSRHETIRIDKYRVPGKNVGMKNVVFFPCKGF